MKVAEAIMIYCAAAWFPRTKCRMITTRTTKDVAPNMQSLQNSKYGCFIISYLC